VQDSALPPKDAQCRFAGCCCVPHEDSIPRTGYNLLQLSVSADNSIQSRFLRISEETSIPLIRYHLLTFRENH
jgi:hypothetical protein